MCLGALLDGGSRKQLQQQQQPWSEVEWHSIFLLFKRVNYSDSKTRPYRYIHNGYTPLLTHRELLLMLYACANM